MRRLSIVLIPGRSMGDLDALLPLALRFWKRNESGRIAIHTIILSDDIQAMVESSAFHADAFGKLSAYHHLSVPRAMNRVSRPWKFLKLLSLLAMLRMKGQVVILSGIDDRSASDSFVRRLLSLFGTSFWFPGNQIGVTAEFSRRFDDKAWSILQDNGAKRDSRSMKIDVDKAICYRHAEIPSLRPRFAEKTKFSVIGTPKLFDEWSAYVGAESRKYVDDELAQLPAKFRATPIATIVVPSPDFFWFSEADGCYRSVIEIVEAFTAQFPDRAVLIKVKPQHLKMFEKNLRLQSDNVRLTTLGLAVLAGRSDVAFSVQETSGIFDFLALGIPVIEYGRYTSEWLEVCPTGSAYSNFPGVTHVESRDNLARAISDLKADRLPRSSVQKLREFLGDVDHSDRWVQSLPGQATAQ